MRSGEKPPTITIDEVEDNPFYTSLIKVVGPIMQKADKLVLNYDTDSMYNHMNDTELFFINIYRICSNVENNLRNIDTAMTLIKHYGKRDYLRKDFVPFDEFSLYHYDVVCYKASTIKDLYFKLVNELYKLELKKCSWEKIEGKESEINNPVLFGILRSNFDVMKRIINKRNGSAHDGKIMTSNLSDISLYLMVSSIQSKFPKALSPNWIYDRNSPIYYAQIKAAKKKILDEISIIRYNSFIITKCLYNSLYSQLEKLKIESEINDS